MADQHIPTDDHPEVPNTSRSAPSSHFEPRRFFANHSPAVWWIFGALLVFVAAGVIVAIATFAAAEGETHARSDVSPAAEMRPGANGGSAVAGQPAPGLLRIRVTAGGFVPDAAIVPRGGNVVFAAEEACDLQQDGSGRGMLAPGQDYRFEADRPGQYTFTCKDSGQSAAITVP